MNFVQTEPQVKSKPFKYYKLSCTVIINRNDNNFVNDKYANNENGYSNFNDFITPN